jgi:uncharacterized protein YndB with AHSA1/START domain
MKTNLLMDFTIDKENRKAIVKREFAANLQLVWEAWTNPEILGQWWAPKPYKAVTKSMDFKVGGCWKYSMCGPNGEVHNCIAEYHSITPLKNYKGLDAFCDEEWNINEDFPRSSWDVTFVEQNGITLVHIETQYDQLSDLEMIIEMGFKEGFTMALQNLEELFKNS